MKKTLFLSLLLFLYSCESADIQNISPQNVSSQVNVSSEATLTQLSSDTFFKGVTQKFEFDEVQLRKDYSKPPSQWPKPLLDEGIKHIEIGPTATVRFPKNNLFSKNKSDLGRMLFSEPKLSKSGSMSCLSCHNPNMGWGDGIQTPMGLDAMPLKRNSPSILNAAYHETLFWDSRAKTLEEQAKMVLLNVREMDSSEELVKKNLSDSLIYKKLFKQAFGNEEITLDKISQALATFERNVVTKNKSKFDQFVLGNKNVLSDSQIRGLHIFRTVGRCLNCHNGTNFTDNQMHNIGLVLEGNKYEDTGKYDLTKKDSDYGLFRTPSLRNVTKTAPYFHNGLVLNLNGLLNIYSNGMPNSRNKSVHIKPLGLETRDRQAVKDFLEALEENVEMP